MILDGGHNPAAMTKSGAALRRLIGTERLVAVFAMLSERDPDQLLAALRKMKPDAVVFTEPGSAGGHAIAGRAAGRHLRRRRAGRDPRAGRARTRQGARRGRRQRAGLRLALPGRRDPGPDDRSLADAEASRSGSNGARMQAPGSQTFYRGTDRILGGVCSGLAEGFHVEVLWVRLAFVVLAFINGVGLLLYVVLWVLMPERAGYRPPGQNAFESMGADIKRAWADLKNQFGLWSGRASGPGLQPRRFAPQAPSAPAPVATEGAAIAARQPRSRSRGTRPSSSARSWSCSASRSWPPTAASTWDVILPAALIALGIVLLVRNLQKRA